MEGVRKGRDASEGKEQWERHVMHSGSLHFSNQSLGQGRKWGGFQQGLGNDG